MHDIQEIMFDNIECSNLSLILLINWWIFFCILEKAATDIYYLRGMKNTLLCYILQIDSCYSKPTWPCSLSLPIRLILSTLTEIRVVSNKLKIRISDDSQEGLVPLFSKDNLHFNRDEGIRNFLLNETTMTDLPMDWSTL